MPGIYVMAVITLALSTLVWGGFLAAFSRKRRWILWLLLPGLPLSALINVLVKRPLAIWLGQVTDTPLAFNQSSPLWFILFMAFLAPLTEEAIKLAPLLLPAIGQSLRSRHSALWAGMALGMSFGLGEIIYLALMFGRSGLYAEYPWWQFTGFLGERLATVFAHGVLTAVSVSGLARSREGGWGWALAGYLGAVLLHALVNLGPVLIPLKLVGAAGAQFFFFIALLVLGGVLFFLQRCARIQEPPPVVEEVLFER